MALPFRISPKLTAFSESAVAKINLAPPCCLNGGFYEKSGCGCGVVPPTAGALVTRLPGGGEEVKMGDVILLAYGETGCMPAQVNGRNMYEVVCIEAEE